MKVEYRVFLDEIEAWEATERREREAVETNGANRKETLAFRPLDGRGGVEGGGVIILWNDPKIVYIALVSRTPLNHSVLIEVFL